MKKNQHIFIIESIFEKNNIKVHFKAYPSFILINYHNHIWTINHKFSLIKLLTHFSLKHKFINSNANKSHSRDNIIQKICIYLFIYFKNDLSPSLIHYEYLETY